MPDTQTELRTQFEKDVYKGLTDYPKHLSSKYIYDKRGDKLFQRIMELPEYYLTRCEFEILSTHQQDIAKLFCQGSSPFQLIELGAGDGKKTRLILEGLLQREAAFHYMPIDISDNALDQLTEALRSEMPALSLRPKQGTYFKVLEDLQEGKNRKVILFLGSNIGNLPHDEAVEFLEQLGKNMRSGDLLFVGFDQKKHPQAIKEAYNDPTGVTEAFNKNLLVRINEELGADFNPDLFMHWEAYNPETGTASSFLVATEQQKVSIERLQLEVEFHQWETIHTEISQKYDDATVNWLAGKAGLEVDREFSDREGLFKDYVLVKK